MGRLGHKISNKEMGDDIATLRKTNKVRATEANKNRSKKEMTRNECENKIAKKLIEIAEIYNQYNPQDEYISMSIQGNHISANNAYFEESHEGGIIDLLVFDYKGDKEVYHREH